MENSLQASPFSLIFAFGLVLVSIIISNREKLKLEKEILIAVARMVIQLTIVAYILGYIFNVDNFWLTSAMIMFIILNAAINVSGRGKGLDRPFLVSFVALFSTTVLTLAILVLSGNLQFTPAQMIPVTGIIAGNSMKSVGLVFTNLFQLYKDQEQSVLERLSLGATPYQASHKIIVVTIKNGIQPTVDSLKTTGLVSLPGMMSGLIMAGIDPIKAIVYQIMVMFMLIGATSFALFIATYLSYPSFFNDRYQLNNHLRDEQ